MFLRPALHKEHESISVHTLHAFAVPCVRHTEPAPRRMRWFMKHTGSMCSLAQSTYHRKNQWKSVVFCSVGSVYFCASKHSWHHELCTDTSRSIPKACQALIVQINTWLGRIANKSSKKRASITPGGFGHFQLQAWICSWYVSGLCKAHRASTTAHEVIHETHQETCVLWRNQLTPVKTNEKHVVCCSVGSIYFCARKHSSRHELCTDASRSIPNASICAKSAVRQNTSLTPYRDILAFKWFLYAYKCVKYILYKFWYLLYHFQYFWYHV